MQDGLLLCGGADINISVDTNGTCRRWNSDTGAWDMVPRYLVVSRVNHSSWTPVNGSGTYLMGGGGRSYKTAEVAEDKRIRIFSLKHHTE